MTSGQINLSGQEIAAQKLVVKQLSLQTAIANNVVYLNDLTATLNDKDYINAHGTVKLEKPFAYTGAATANLADLSTFEPLLGWRCGRGGPGSATPATDRGREEDAARRFVSLELEGAGRGRHFQEQRRPQPQTGKRPLRRFAKSAGQRRGALHAAGIEGPDRLSRRATSSIFQAILQAKDSTLEISKIQIDQGTAKYASAYASLPFTWSNLGSERPLFPPNGKVAINLQTENLDLAKLFKDLGKEPPVAGQLSVKLDAQGPLDQLVANLDLQLQSLRADAVKQLEPATINFGAAPPE